MTERLPGGVCGVCSDAEWIGVFHEVAPEHIDQILHDGIACSGSGAKTGGAEQQTDTFLDAHIPPGYAERGVSRGSVIYGYLPIGDRLIDIRTGQTVEARTFASRHGQALVRLHVDRSRCFVSDLDCYDIVKEGLNSLWPHEALQRWAARYWDKVVPLERYVAGSHRRPEVMVVGDVDASDITVVSSD